MKNKTVLVSVLKDKRDRRILLQEHWYRIPVTFLPKRRFRYIAFYEPAIFGKHGKQIRYFATVRNTKVEKRINLLPQEKEHPRAHENYLRITLVEIKKLPRPIKNIVPRRICFGFTTLRKLFSSKDILELYGVPPTEQIVWRRLNAIGIKTVKEFTISQNSQRYRLDFAVFYQNGQIAIECDNDKAHNTRAQIKKDRKKDRFLRRNGWRVIRFKEKDIIENLDRCISRVQKICHLLASKKSESES